MRRALLWCLIILELGIAGMLIRLGGQLPERAEVEQSFTKAREVTAHAGEEIQHIRTQVDLLRRPELPKLAVKLQEQLQVVTKMLHDRKVDFDTVGAVRDGLGGVADGLALFAKTLDAGHLEQLAEGLGVTADYLDKELLPAANSAGIQLNKSTDQLAKSAEAAAKVFEELTLDTAALKEVHDGLAQFGKGLDKMHSSLEVKRLKTLQDGFDGMHTALTTGAEQVEKLAGFSYPVVVFNGFRPNVQTKAFWPSGAKIAAGLRKAGDGVKAAQEEMADVVKTLPELQASIAGSQKVIEGTRKALDFAIKQHDVIEPLLKEIPKQTTKLATDLPKLGQDLAAVLKNTGKFASVAQALRKAQKELQTSAKNWPQLKKSILASAGLLQATRLQLDQAVLQRKHYENAVDQTVHLGEGVAAMLPLLSEQMTTQLEEQDRSLYGLGQSLAEVGDSMAVYGDIGGRLVDTVRWLVWLMALLVTLHAIYRFAGLWKRLHGA